MIFGKNDTVKNPTNAGKLYEINADKYLLQTLHLAPKIRRGPTPGEGGTPLFGPCGYVPLNRVWFSRSWVLISLLSVLNRVSFWTGSLSKSVNTCDERAIFAIPIIFFLNIYFQYFSVKNYLILYAKQSKSGSKRSVSSLKQGSEMRSLCLKQGRGLRASAAHLHPDFPWVPNRGSHMLVSTPL